MSKSEFVHEDIAVHKLLGHAHLVAFTKADKRLTTGLDFYLGQIEIARDARDSYDEDILELSKPTISDAYANFLSGMLNDYRNDRYKAEAAVSDRREKLIIELE